MNTTRRDFLGGTLSLATLLVTGCEGPMAIDDDGNFIDTDGNAVCLDPFADGEFLGVVEFTGEDNEREFGIKYEVGWDARLLFDLTTLDPESSTSVSNDQFYIRTEYPDQLRTNYNDWRVRVHGLVDTEVELSMADLEPLVEDQGEVLLECSGNTDNSHFGLMSAAQWAGIPFERILELVSVDASATAVVISGFDDHSAPSDNNHSTPGAAWNFRLSEIEGRGFLATEMNGQALPDDHGAPIRLVMPSWFGCTCIKWVNRIEFVADDEDATSQMIEFATRTHQTGEHAKARDYSPANIDQSAMPVRVEKWRLDGEIVYRVVGILWGGEEPVTGLAFHDNADVDTVSLCPEQQDNRSWTLWVHAWRPGLAGSHTLSMEVTAPKVSTRRLDTGWYLRTVAIDEV